MKEMLIVVRDRMLNNGKALSCTNGCNNIGDADNCQFSCSNNGRAPLCSMFCNNNGNAFSCTQYCTNNGGAPLCSSSCRNIGDTPLCTSYCYNTGDAPLCTSYCYNTGIAPLCTFECYSRQFNIYWNSYFTSRPQLPTLTPTQTPFPILSSSEFTTTYGINGVLRLVSQFAGEIYTRKLYFFEDFLWKCKFCLSDFIFISPCNL